MNEQRDYPVPVYGFGARALAALGMDSERDWVTKFTITADVNDPSGAVRISIERLLNLAEWSDFCTVLEDYALVQRREPIVGAKIA